MRVQIEMKSKGKGLFKFIRMTVTLGCLLSCLLPVVGCKSSSTSTGRSDPSFGSSPDYKRAAAVNVELGLGYLAQGQISRAKGKLFHALELAPRSAAACSAMAQFHETVGEVIDAEVMHRKAIRYAKGGGGAENNNYAIFLCKQGRSDEADRFFKQALNDTKYTRTAEVYENAGLCALKENQIPKAENYLQIALQRDPQRVDLLIKLASIAWQNGRTAEAQGLLDQYEKKGAMTAEFLDLRIQVARKLNQAAAVAQYAVLLGQRFPDSQEYAAYVGVKK